MNRAHLMLALAGVFSITSAAQAAQQGYVKAYDAVYELTTPTTTATMHQMSDGKGHMRTETAQSGTKTTSIMDFAGKMSYTLMDAQKMYLKQPLSSAQQESADWEKQKPSAKTLGKKVVDSHPCHGYESRTGAIVSQVWIGDDIKNLVRSESSTPQGKTIMALKSYSGNAPAQDLLAIPSGYKEMKMPKIAGMK